MRLLLLLLAFLTTTAAAQDTWPGRPEDAISRARLGLTAPAVVHVHATAAPLRAGLPHQAVYEWDFGDPASPYNRLRGFNAAHLYAAPGRYTLRLRVTDAAGNVAEYAEPVVVTPDNRTRIYLAADGDDSASGRSPDAPRQSLAAALRDAPANTVFRLRAGDTFPVGEQINITGNNVLIESFVPPGATARRATLHWVGPPKSSIIGMTRDTRDVLLRDLAFTTRFLPAAPDDLNKALPVAIYPAGANIAVINCTFTDVGDCINSEWFPRWVLVQDCSDTGPTSVRGFFAWVQGSDHVYLGNTSRNSTREHCIRATDFERLLVSHNWLQNLDRRPVDKQDDAKGTAVAQRGQFAWISQNRLAVGGVGVGPVGGPDSLKPGAEKHQTRFAVIEWNAVVDTSVAVWAGSQHTTIRQNSFDIDERYALYVQVQTASPPRRTSDVRFLQNRIDIRGTNGGLLCITHPANFDPAVVIDHNAVLAPNLISAQPFGLFRIDDPDFRGIASAKNNRLPNHRPQSPYERGPWRIGDQYFTEQEAQTRAPGRIADNQYK